MTPAKQWFLPETGGVCFNLLLPSGERRGMHMMVTYSDLIQIGILIVGVINLVLQIKKK